MSESNNQRRLQLLAELSERAYRITLTGYCRRCDRVQVAVVSELVRRPGERQDAIDLDPRCYHCHMLLGQCRARLTVVRGDHR